MCLFELLKQAGNNINTRKLDVWEIKKMKFSCLTMAIVELVNQAHYTTQGGSIATVYPPPANLSLFSKDWDQRLKIEPQLLV